MTRACIDTHALVWHASHPKRLGRGDSRLLRAADAGRAEILIPTIVAIELTLLRESGRHVIGVPQLEALVTNQPSFRILPLDLAQAAECAALESVDDPFDRMIISAARAAGVALITADTRINESALVETIWD